MGQVWSWQGQLNNYCPGSNGRLWGAGKQAPASREAARNTQKGRCPTRQKGVSWLGSVHGAMERWAGKLRQEPCPPCWAEPGGHRQASDSLGDLATQPQACGQHNSSQPRGWQYSGCWDTCCLLGRSQTWVVPRLQVGTSLPTRGAGRENQVRRGDDGASQHPISPTAGSWLHRAPPPQPTTQSPQTPKACSPRTLRVGVTQA